MKKIIYLILCIGMIHANAKESIDFSKFKYMYSKSKKKCIDVNDKEYSEFKSVLEKGEKNLYQMIR